MSPNPSGARSSAARAGGRPLISVVITNYNYAGYVGAAIKSVLNQTYPHVELIVVDDGSTDGSREIIRSLDVRLIEQANGGQIAACATGIAETTGDVVMLLDADDTFHPDTCARIAAAYAPDIALYQGALVKVDPQGNRLGDYPDQPLLDRGHREHMLRHGYFPSSPTSGNAYAGDHARSMFLEAMRRDRPVRVNGGDGLLIYSAPFVGRVVRLDHDGPFGTYLVHGANQSAVAGVDSASAYRDTRDGVWQRIAIPIALDRLKQPHGPASDYLTAFLLRQVLILRCSYDKRDIVPELSNVAIARMGVAKFLIYPRLTIAQRLKNVALMVALLCGATSLGKVVTPPAASPKAV